MNKIIISLLFFLAVTKPSMGQIGIPEFSKFFGKQFRVSPAFRKNCEFSFFSILMQTDNSGTIKSVDFKNEVPEDMKVYFDFLKGYQFPEKYAIKNKPVLFFITIDRSDYCPDFKVTNPHMNEIMRTPLLIIKKQLAANAKTIVFYDTFVTRLSRGTVN